MAFDNTVPAADIPFNETIVPIKDNFAAIQTAFDINHGSLTDIQGNAGKHMKVSFLEQPRSAISINGKCPISATDLTKGASTTFDIIFEDTPDQQQPIGIVGRFPLTLAKFDATEGWSYIGGTDLVLFWGEISITSATTNNSILLTDVIDTDTPFIRDVIYGHLSLKTKDATTPMDAEIYLRFVNRITPTNQFEIGYTIRKRSAYNTAISASILPLTANYILLGFVPRGTY